MTAKEGVRALSGLVEIRLLCARAQFLSASLNSRKYKAQQVHHMSRVYNALLRTATFVYSQAQWKDRHNPKKSTHCPYAGMKDLKKKEPIRTSYMSSNVASRQTNCQTVIELHDQPSSLWPQLRGPCSLDSIHITEDLERICNIATDPLPSKSILCILG